MIGASRPLVAPVRDYPPQFVPEPPEVHSSALGERASLCGAIALAIYRVRQEVLAR